MNVLLCPYNDMKNYLSPFLLLFLALLLSIAIGSVFISPKELWDVILGDSMWGVTSEAVKGRAGWETLPAVQSDSIFPFDDNLVSRPGPRLVDGLEQLAKLLRPELFK